MEIIVFVYLFLLFLMIVSSYKAAKHVAYINHWQTGALILTFLAILFIAWPVGLFVWFIPNPNKSNQ